MTLAEDKRPEANRLIGLRPHSSERHTWDKYMVDVALFMIAEYQLVVDEISDAMPNSRINRRGN